MNNTIQNPAEKKPDNPIAKYVRQEHIMNGSGQSHYKTPKIQK